MLFYWFVPIESGQSHRALLARAEAAVIPERWAKVLAAFAKFASAKDAALIAARGTSFIRWIVTSPEFNEAAVAHSQRYPNHLRTSRLINAQHPGFLTDRDLLTRDEINREPVYQELMIPRGYGSAIATAIICRRRSPIWHSG